jgi:hypothetical protein
MQPLEPFSFPFLEPVVTFPKSVARELGNNNRRTVCFASVERLNTIGLPKELEGVHEGYWRQIELYIRDHSEAEFTHGICPVCAEKLYPEYYPHEKKE